MYQKILSLIKKYESILSYLFFGGLTTLVNFIVYYPLYNIVELSATLSNCIAWIAAVAFAYLTNKPFVFKSNDWSAKVIIPELARFVACRIGSGAAETLIIFVTVDLLSINGNIMKIATSILVVILNYIASKLLVFRKSNNK